MYSVPWAGTICWATCFHPYSPNVRLRKDNFSRQHFKKDKSNPDSMSRMVQSTQKLQSHAINWNLQQNGFIKVLDMNTTNILPYNSVHMALLSLDKYEEQQFSNICRWCFAMLDSFCQVFTIRSHPQFQTRLNQRYLEVDIANRSRRLQFTDQQQVL